MTGVVRRDGLREAVAAVLRDHNLVSYFGDGKCTGCGLALFDGKITSTTQLRLASDAAAEHRADMLVSLLVDAVPDVPPTEARPCWECGAPDGHETHCAQYDPASPGADSTSPLATARSLAAGTVERGGEPSPRPGDAALPVVPPDPPAATHDELARVLGKHPVTFVRAPTSTWIRCGCGDNYEHAHEYEAHLADALLSSGVLVAAADVRASALEDAAKDARRSVGAVDDLSLTHAEVADWLELRAYMARDGNRDEDEACDYCGCHIPPGEVCKYGPHDNDETPEDAITRRRTDRAVSEREGTADG